MEAECAGCGRVVAALSYAAAYDYGDADDLGHGRCGGDSEGCVECGGVFKLWGGCVWGDCRGGEWDESEGESLF